jgi:hypothetical protein
MIPTCCGSWHNVANHLITFYLCPEYWTILDPISLARDSYPALESQLHNALTESFIARRLPPPTLPPYIRTSRIAVQEDNPLPPWSCGTFAMNTTLHLLLGDELPHAMPPHCITREHMLDCSPSTKHCSSGSSMRPLPSLWETGCQRDNIISPITTES